MTRSSPFAEEYELNKELQLRPQAPPPQAGSIFLPGQPRINLDDPRKLSAFLEREFGSKDMETMAPHLWLMSKQSSSNISPLHRQKVKGREVVITEDPKLHLVWINDRIFLKPLPEYLLSYRFWNEYLLDLASPLGARRNHICAAALGYLRTYFFLIKHESDLRMAQDERALLVPERITWKQFCDFSAQFESISDNDVSMRYQFGELRLTRLNFYSKFFLHKFDYQRIHGQYGAYFARFYGPILFAIGVLSVLLSAMQVVLAVEQIKSRHWTSLWVACRWFSVASLLSLGLVIMCLMALFAYKFCSEWKHALSDHYGKTRRLQGNAGNIHKGQNP